MNFAYNSDTSNPENDRDETTYHSFVLRIWKSGGGALKGYILDPITDESFPLVNTSHEGTTCQKVWIEQIACWLTLSVSDNYDEKNE